MKTLSQNHILVGAIIVVALLLYSFRSDLTCKPCQSLIERFSNRSVAITPITSSTPTPSQSFSEALSSPSSAERIEATHTILIDRGFYTLLFRLTAALQYPLLCLFRKNSKKEYNIC